MGYYGETKREGSVLIFTIASIAVVLIAVAGFVMQKNGELAGIGRRRTSRLRAPHGALVRTKRLDNREALAPIRLLPRVLLPEMLVTVVLGGLCVVKLFDAASAIPVAVQGIVVMILGAGVAHAEVGIWRALGWSIAGYLIVGGGLSFAVYALEGSLPFVDTGFVNLTTMVCGALGSSAAIALVPARRSYAREFEDGYVNAIEVSSHSVAARFYDELDDPTWTPPRDLADVAHAGEDVRKQMNRRAEERELR